MAIPITCPGCKKSFNVDDKFAGKTGPCPNCKTKITIPAKQPEVKIHTPEEFGGGGKSVTGKLLLKPIKREETRVTPLAAGTIGGAVLVAIGWALAIRLFTPAAEMPRYLLSGAGLLLVSPPLAIAAYTFLRDVDLAPYRGMGLYLRASICALIYIFLWFALVYLKGQLDLKNNVPMWFVVAPPIVLFGGVTGKFAFDLETANGFFHYAFYVAATMILAAIAGIGMVWQ